MSRYNGHLYDTIVCFGDSLTQHGWDVKKHGWVAQLSQAYLRRLDVINRGFSGYNSRWVRFLFPQITPTVSASTNEPQSPPANAPIGIVANEPANEARASKLRLLTIFLGANDAHLPSFKCHVPLDEFKSNIQFFVHSVTSPTSTHYSRDTRVVLITPPPLGEKLWKRQLEIDSTTPGEPVQMDRSNNNVRKYAEAVKSVAQEYSVPCIDLWSEIEARVKQLKETKGEELKYDGYEEFFWDGLHLNANGNDVLFELLMGTVRSNFPELDPDQMPFVVPDHRQISGNEDFAQLLRF